jgi:ATP-dependent helicase/nuclease subunit B
MNDRDRDRLNQLGLELAPTSRQNTFIEQFYLYTMMTKPTQKLVLSYSLAGGDNAAMTPSYLIGRVLRMFPKLGVQKRTIRPFYGTIQTDLFFLTKGLRQLLEQSGEAFRQEEFHQTALLYRIFAAGDREQELELIRRGMQFDNGANPLSQEARDAVKERLLAQSVSKLEKYAGCAYAYFLQYGLRLRERERYEIDTRNIGNILHYALRETFTEVKQQYANDWSSLSEQQLCGIMRQQVEAACSREKEGLLSEKGRMQFVIQNLQSIGERTIRTLRYQIVSGKMKPVYFEKAFSGMSGIQQAKLQVKGMEVPLSGIIDRGDLKVEDENVYVKLVDYKSGNRDFQLEYFYEGLQLQLVVYMNVLLEIVARDYPNKQVIPAGMYYYHMDDPYLEQETEDEEAAEDAIRKTLRCHGVPNLDGDILEMQEQDILEKDSGRVLPLDIKKGELVPESYGADTAQFQRLCSFGKHKMEQLAEQLLDGNISKAPALKNETLTCAYCDYRSVCRFDSSYSGNRIRKLKYSAREKREIWQSMTEADKEGGSEDGGME